MSWRIRLGKVLLVALGAAAVAVAVIIGTRWSPQSKSPSFELYKYLIQFLMITALGAVVALLVEEYRRSREQSHRQRQYAIDSITSVLRQLGEIVSAVKRDRARLRRRWLEGKPSREEYFDAILELQDHKDDLDRLWHEVQVLEEVLPKLGLEGTHLDVQTMEHYFTDLVKESEEVAKLPAENFDPHGESVLRFRKFLARTGDRDPPSSFPDFSGRYHRARPRLIKALGDRRLGSYPGLTVTECDDRRAAKQHAPPSAL